MLTNLLWIMTEEHYQRYLKEFSSNKELKDFLVNVFVVFTEIVKRGIFLKDWIVIIMLGNRWVTTGLDVMILAQQQLVFILFNIFTTEHCA